MPAVSPIAAAVAGSVAAAGANKLMSGGSSAPPGAAGFSPITADENNRVSGIDTELKRLEMNQADVGAKATTNANDITSLFTQHLKDFLNQGPNPSADQIQKSSDYVDSIFTKPAQAVVNQKVNEYQGNAGALAASLGRNPNIDVATQQAIASEIARQNMGLQVERGNQIQNELGNVYNRNVNSLNTGLQGSTFLNNLAQQALSNQVNLLNGRTGIASFYQRERSQNYPTPVSSPGLLGQLSSGLGQVSGLIGIGKGLTGQIGSLFPSGSSNTSSSGSYSPPADSGGFNTDVGYHPTGAGGQMI